MTYYWLNEEAGVGCKETKWKKCKKEDCWR